MKPRELFNVAVKCVGLYYIVQGIWSLLRILDIVVPLITSRYERFDSSQRIAIGTQLGIAVLYFLISALFLKFGDRLTRIAFPSPQNEKPSKADTDVAA